MLRTTSRSSGLETHAKQSSSARGIFREFTVVVGIPPYHCASTLAMTRTYTSTAHVRGDWPAVHVPRVNTPTLQPASPGTRFLPLCSVPSGRSLAPACSPDLKPRLRCSRIASAAAWHQTRPHPPEPPASLWNRPRMSNDGELATGHR